MTKPVILTGLRANNDLTIGNYFGGMLPIIETARERAGEYQINMFIPDLHSFTTPIDHDQLQGQIMHNARLFAAAGLPLDNEDILLYRQSYVPAHSELTWILDNFSSFGVLTRMTQFKDKAKYSDPIEVIRSLQRKTYSKMEETRDLIKDPNDTMKLLEALNIYNDFALGVTDLVDELLNSEESGIKSTVGLFNYPVLMASDILLYGAQYIPVGDDQSQHLEFTRDIAERMNNRFGDLFVIPEEVSKQHEFFNKGQGLRIKDLMDPSKKMSKSDDSGKGVIFLTDNPGEAAKKVMSAATDNKASINYDPIEQPGVSNLLQILALLRGQSVDDVELAFKGQSSYGDFKRVIADEVAGFLTVFQAKLNKVDDNTINAAFERSEKVANDQANATLYRVQQAVGLRQKG